MGILKRLADVILRCHNRVNAYELTVYIPVYIGRADRPQTRMNTGFADFLSDSPSLRQDLQGLQIGGLFICAIARLCTLSGGGVAHFIFSQ